MKKYKQTQQDALLKDYEIDTLKSHKEFVQADTESVKLSYRLHRHYVDSTGHTGHVDPPRSVAACPY
jgi:hypothetical protein